MARPDTTPVRVAVGEHALDRRQVVQEVVERPVVLVPDKLANLAALAVETPPEVGAFFDEQQLNRARRRGARDRNRPVDAEALVACREVALHRDLRFAAKDRADDLVGSAR